MSENEIREYALMKATFKWLLIVCYGRDWNCGSTEQPDRATRTQSSDFSSGITS